MSQNITFSKLRFLFMLVIGMLMNPVYAQIGPGGIGNADGSSSQPRNLVWLVADSVAGADGSDVTLWEDISGNQFNFTQPDASFTPILRTGQLNGHNIVEFSKANNRIVHNPFDEFPSDEISAIFVMRTTDNDAGILSYSIPSESNEYLVYHNPDINTYVNGNNDNSGTNINDGNWLIYGHQWRSSDGALSIYRDNQQIYNVTHQNGASVTSGGSLAIGGEQDVIDGGYNVGQAFQGDVAEVILFDRYLNAAQKIIIDNYLNEKYGIALAANDFLTGNDPAYIFDVAGIGQSAGETHDQLNSAGMILESAGGMNDGDFVLTAHDNAVNDTFSINTSADVTGSGAEAAWNRNWYIEKTNNLDARVAFDMKNGIEGGQYPVGISNYVLLYRSGTSGTYSIVQTADGISEGSKVYFDIADADLQDGYYTLGTNDQDNSPVQGAPGRTWYTLVSGDWDDWETWTLDPSGSLPDNPDNLTPSTSPTNSADKVVILSGRTVDVSSDNLQNAILEVKGRLDLASTIGHDFGEIRGNGHILMSSDNFPSGDATHFITAGQGEGTAEFYGGDYNVTTSREFYHVEIALDNYTNMLTLMNDLKVNGDLHVLNGTLQVNDNTATTAFDINVNGSITIDNAGAMTVGQGNAYHQLTLKGDLMNYGSLAFTNRTTPNYTASATDGVIELIANDDNKDQLIQCNGPSVFYRLEIDKGIDKTYVLTIIATDPSNFALYGRANYGHGNQAQLTTNANALGLLRGTVKIGNNVDIPVLNTTGNYNISEQASLWVDGGSVAKTGGTAIVPYGLLKITAGTVDALVNSGVTLRQNGRINISGGTLNVNQIRTSTFGAGHVGGYVQSGGTVNVVGGSSNTDYYLFNLTFEGNVFNMQGGILNIEQANTNGAVFIKSDASNINVSGGTVNMEVGNNNDFVVTSTAPFWNVNMRNTAGNNNIIVLDDGNNVGATNEFLAAQPFRVLNDLTIESNTQFKTNAEDVEVGRHFTIQDDAIYDFDDNTTIFNGTEDATLTIGDITGIDPASIGYVDPEGDDPYARWEQPFYGFTIDKPADKTLTLSSGCTYDAGGTGPVKSGGCKNIYDWRNNLVKVTGPFVLESGIFDIDEFSVRLYDEITNKGICAVDAVPENAYIKTRKENTPSTRTVNTTEGAEFGNFRLNTGEGILEFTSDVYIKRLQYRHGRINIGTHNLKIDDLFMDLAGGETQGGNPSVEDMFITDGNASDGGLSLYIPADGTDPSEGDNTFEFPFGLGTDGVDITDGGNSKYTPAALTVLNATDDGYVTIRPVNSVLQTIEPGNHILEYYWRVQHSGFTNPPTISYQFNYYDADATGNETQYVPGKILNESPYTRSSENDGVDRNANTITFDGTGTGFAVENANYSAGQDNRFDGEVHIFYTRDYGAATGGAAREPDWEDAQTWTRSDILNPSYDPHDSRQSYVTTGAPDSRYPGPGDIAVIGWVPWTDTQKPQLAGQPHGVWVDNTTIQVAEVRFTQMTDAAGNPVPRVYRSNFQFRPTICINWDNGNLQAGLVKGEGLFWNRNSNPDFTLMDIGEFAKEDSSYVIYESWDNPNTITNTPPLFPNLMVATDAWGGNDKDFTFDQDIVTNGYIELLGDINVVLDNDNDGDITVGTDLIMYEFQGLEGDPSGGGAEIAFPNTGTSRTITVGHDIYVDNAGANLHVRNPNASDTDHQIFLNGDYYQNSAAGGADGLQLFSATGDDAVTLHFVGDSSTVFEVASGDIPQLYRAIVDKGNDQSKTVDFISDFDLNGPTSGAGVPKALELLNGKVILNHPDINIDLNTGNDDFVIPSTGALEIAQGQVNVSGDNTGIYLDGSLEISGGTLDMDSGAGNGNNYIEYSSSGNARIQISAGNLWVGSQIRRGLLSDVGILEYTQLGGNVQVGINAAPENNRGVFEIVGDGSSFVHTGGSLEIVRQQDNPLIAALYLDPQNHNLGSATEITLGNANTPADQNIGIYAAFPLQHLRVNNASTNSPNARLWVLPHTIAGDLTIDAGASFDANGKQLFIEGDLINSGTFIPNGNITTFQGTSDQSIVGNTNFYNLTKTTSTTLELDASGANIVVNNIFDLQGGILNDHDNSMEVKGNINFNGSHAYGGSGNGIILNGTAEQLLTGDGSFGRLVINNANGVTIPIGNEFFISNTLSLQQGIFDVGKNLLEIGVNADIEEASPFSETNMIQTNISFTDQGVRKYLPSGATNFTFPIGSGGKYTPVDFTISSNSSASGYITVKPANELHPSILDDTESPDPEIVDEDNVLQYHWVLNAGALTDFSATVEMKYHQDDVEVTAPYDIFDYITARILNDGSGNWNKFDDVDKFDEGAEVLVFDFGNTDENGVSGDYTAGVDGSSFNGAIPDQVPAYESVMNGNWSTDATWSPVISGGPRGAMVTISTTDSVVSQNNYISSYSTKILGTLDLGTTFGHRLGYVDGTGTLYLETGAIPAGSYNDFFGASGGTLEFSGNSTYDILGGHIEVNNIVISGGGEKRLPNQDIMLNGDMVIDGPLLSNDHNKQVSLKGDLSLINGGFDAGIGTSSTVIFNGSVQQSIAGDFTGTNQFNNFMINNSASVQLQDNVEINRQLNLTDGVITTNGNVLTVKQNGSISPVQGSASSFVDGILSKELVSGQNFTYPIGDGNEQGIIQYNNVTGFGGVQPWDAEYRFNNPTMDGYDATSFSAPIESVSSTEYWSLQGSAGGESNITFHLDGSSDVANGASMDSLLIVTWNGSEWVQVGGTPTYTGSASAGTISTSTPVNFDGSQQIFTLASRAQVILPTATITSGDDDLCAGDTSSMVIILTGEAPWDIEYSDGTTTFPVNGINTSTYSIDVSPASTTTYSLVSVSDNNGPGSLTGDTSVVITVNTAPDADILVSQTDVCPGVSINLDGNPSGGSGNYADHNWTGSGATYLSNAGIQTPEFSNSVTGSYFLQYTVTDDNGCVGTDTITLNVDDNTPPTIICQNITVYLDGTGNASISYTDIDNGSADDCGNVTLSLDDSTFTCADVPISPVTVTLTGIDNSGNVDSCNAFVTVLDTITPSVSCPLDSLVYVDAACEYTVPDFTSLATTGDNCPGGVTVSQSPVAGTVLSGAGTTQTITLTADDNNGNTADCTFEIELVDTIAPTFNCPADIDTVCAASSGGTAIVNDIAPTSPDDNCSGTGDLTITYELTGATTDTGNDDASGTTFNVGVTTVTYTITDEAGNSTDCSFDVTVNDLPGTGVIYRLPNE